MKITKQAILLSALALGLGACSDENPWGYSAGEGGIALKLQTSTDVKDAIPVLRSGVETLEAPETSNFAVSLKNLATDEVKTWQTLADFTGQGNFAAGSYTLSAYYGALEDEGFDKPYFYGEAQVQVLEGRQSEVEVTASLANSMVSVDYTDAFKEYFKDYKVTVHSAGHSYVDFEKGEARPAFIAPGEVDITVAVTNPNGQSVTLQPAAFPAAAKHHYHITFDVNGGNVGTAQLQIIFDDSVVTEDVTIDLTDELFTSAAPKVEPEGFTDGQMLEALEGNPLTDKVRFNVIARGGLKSAVLTITGENGYVAPCGNEVDLVSASADTQAKLAGMGIKAVGLYKNPSSMAYVDLSEFASSLTEGKYSVSLVVKDGYTRCSEPLTVNFTTVPLALSVEPGIAIYGTNQATVTVNYNGLDPQNNISFKALSKAGTYKDASVLNVTESTRTRAFETKTYTFVIELPDTDHKEIPVKVIFGGKEKATVTLQVTIPEYELEVDPFATYAKVKVNTKAEDLAVVTNSLMLSLGGRTIAADRVVRNNETGIITLLDLTPSTVYSLGAGLVTGVTDKTIEYTTETATNVPNGDFSQTTQTINRSGVNSGGEFRNTAAVWKQNKTSVTAYEPNGWASINQKTAYENVTNLNTWYFVRSTYVENGEAIVRSVGYNHSGNDISGSGNVANTTYYCTNAPADADLMKVSGELFLGSYSFNGNESRTNGISFGSRPSSVEFDYKYAAVASETGSATVRVLDGLGIVIASGSIDLTAASDMTKGVINLTGYPFQAKASTLEICFRSTKGETVKVNIPTGDALNDGATYGDRNIPANQSKAVATGSVLTIDNVKLNY